MPGFASAFAAATRSRCGQFLSADLCFFTQKSNGQEASPTHSYVKLIQARTLYGAGMGFVSLSILAAVVKATAGLRWEEGGEMADALTEVDTDLGQIGHEFR
jgi:hypothetical protein